jgi:hypothetical protein
MSSFFASGERFSLAVALLAAPALSLACTCTARVPAILERSLKEAAIVAIVEVESVRIERNPKIADPYPPGGQTLYAKVTYAEVLKATQPLPAEVFVGEWHYGFSCKSEIPRLGVGGQYLLVLSDKGELFPCSGSTHIDERVEEIATRIKNVRKSLGRSPGATP